MSQKESGMLAWNHRRPRAPGWYLCVYHWRVLPLKIYREGGDLLVRNFLHPNGDTFGMILVNGSKREMWWLGPLPCFPVDYNGKEARP